MNYMSDTIDISLMRERVETIEALPTVPATLKQISGMLEKPRLSIEELGRFIAGDPALTSKILKMVNSAAYGFPNRISSISHAIMLLGLNVVRGLLLGVSVFELMRRNIEGLWEHSLGCAVAARWIAQKKQVKEPEEVSVCGLLHDIGKVILILHFPEEYEKVQAKAGKEGITLHEAERLFFDATHSDVGSWLARKWRFPVNLVEAIEYHHRPRLSKSAQLETAIVHVSDALVHAKGIGTAHDDLVPTINPDAWGLLQLSVNDIKAVLDELEEAASSETEVW